MSFKRGFFFYSNDNASEPLGETVTYWPFARTTCIHESARHKHSGVVHQDPSSATFPHDQPDFQKTDRLQYQGPNRWPLRHLKEDHVVISILRSLLTDNPPIPGKVGHTTGIYVVWALLRPTIIRQVKVLWNGTYGFSSSKKTRKINRLQMLLQRQRFLLSYLKTLSVGPVRVCTRDLPLSRSALSQLS